MAWRKTYEDGLQETVRDWIDMKHPGWLWGHVANERKTTKQQGARLKAKGVKRGVPDVMIWVPWQDAPDPTHKLEYLRRHHAAGIGVAIELKAPGKYPTPEQRAWLIGLEEMHWYPAVCRTIHEVTNLCERIVRKP